MLFYLVLLFTNVALAGDEVKAGTVLKQDSYVFSIEEAEKLKAKIEDLEKKEKLLTEFQQLDILRTQQSDLLTSSIDLKDKQIILYKDIISEKDLQIKLIEKRNKTQFITNSAIFLGGVLFTGTAIYFADKFDDSLEK